MLNEPVFGIGLDNELSNFLGLITFHCIPGPTISDTDLLEISIPDSSLAPVRLSGLLAGRRHYVHLHHALLPTGDQKVSFRLFNAQRSLIFSLDYPVLIRDKNSLALAVEQRLKAFGTSWAFFGLCDSSYYPFSQITKNDPLTPWFDRDDAPEHIARLRASKQIDDLEAKQLEEFVDKGIFILENVIPPDLTDAVNAEIDDAVSKGWQDYKLGSSQRIEHLHLYYPNVRKLWLHPAHRRWTNLLFGVKARPCQTLTYVYGSQQDAHQDTIHLTTFPAGNMCGVWIALQDIVPDSGELVYYPGSHRERRIYMNELKTLKTIVATDWSAFESKALPAWSEIGSRYRAVTYRPKRGTMAIWHENLLHGGSPRKDQTLQRRSIVIHTYAEGSVAFADSSGISCVAAPMSAVV